jgi:hypothetical protein
MSKRFLAVALVLTLLATGGWALAQQSRPPGTFPPPDDTIPRGVQVGRPPGPQVAPPPAPPPPPVRAIPGRFTVVAAGAQAVQVDTATGDTWLLHPSGDGRAVWVPTRRLNSDKEVGAWQKAKATSRREQEKEKAELDDLRRIQQQRAQVEREQAQKAEAEALRALEDAQRRLKELQKKQAP